MTDHVERITLSEAAAGFVRDLPPDEKRKARELIESLRVDSLPDGIRIFDARTKGLPWRALVEPGFLAMLFRIEDGTLFVGRVERPTESVSSNVAKTQELASKLDPLVKSSFTSGYRSRYGDE